MKAEKAPSERQSRAVFGLKKLKAPPLRAFLGLGVPLRGVHAGAEAQARLLRAASALEIGRYWLGQRSDER